MANLAARQADLGTAITDLKTLVTNCTTDIANADSDAEAIRRLKEQAESALESFGLTGSEEGPPVT